ncbi:MAG: bifunctional folylpolyglutamate synthase/dihydrofolate synthase [Ignavibacteriales bacterium]|nr:bifunctional folylpolyglutamate synthase/dihydrofolate synthase [Ignavibacteriales bacterium]
MQETLSYLYSLHKFGMKFGLRNIRSLLRFVDNPHTMFKSIHVAGTNGKGSTSSMIAAILTAAGYKVGLYTSPHLVTFNERIRINGKMISDADVVKYTKKLRPQIHRLKATFFEATTAMAFKYFADQKIDVAVIETGLGGRLDSTNVITPLVSVITSIGKDHTEHLGKTVASIAAEKAGIIKDHIPVVIGMLSNSARSVVLNRAKEVHSTVLYANRVHLPKNVTVQLKGKHQTMNARCAVAASIVASKHFLIGDNAIRKGLELTSQLSGLRARFEFINSKPAILLDVAHNPDGIKTLVREIRRLSFKKHVVVFAVMKDKDYRSIGRELKKLKAELVITQPNVERALPAKELFKIYAAQNLNVHFAESVPSALSLGRKLAGKHGLLTVTGSHYLVGEAITKLKI